MTKEPQLLIDKYKLIPLQEIKKDDIGKLLNVSPGVYICNFQEKLWYDNHNFKQKKNSSLSKKENFFKLLNPESYLLSPTSNKYVKSPTKDITNGKILHFGTKNFKGRIGQFVMAFRIISWMRKNKSKFEFCLIYNFYFPQYLISLYAKYILRKKLYVDFEDDYSLTDRTFFKKWFFSLVKHTPDSVICINEHMKNHFIEKKKISTYVFNGFIDLSYTKQTDFSFKENMTFLFGGNFDNIRGVDLIPSFILEMKKKLTNFKVLVTGSGVLSPIVEKWDFPELELLGFLDEEDYLKTLASSDAFLVLQKPDHPFSKGSFPSKIEYYSKFKKPIYYLVSNNVNNE